MRGLVEWGPRQGALKACPVAIGDTFERKPSSFSREGWSGPVKLHWTVIAVNEKHRTYTAEAMCHGHRLRETFKF